jgi:hypothetical protein
MVPPKSEVSLGTLWRHTVPVVILFWYAWLLVTIVVVASWLFRNPDIAVLLMLYVTGPVVMIWIVVRVIRYAWKGD